MRLPCLLACGSNEPSHCKCASIPAYAQTVEGDVFSVEHPTVWARENFTRGSYRAKVLFRVLPPDHGLDLFIVAVAFIACFVERAHGVSP